MAGTKQLVMGLAAGAIIGGTVLGTIGVSAQETATTLPDRIADRFGISSEEVKEEFQAHREEKQAVRQAAFTEHLQSKVDDGTITAEQKTLVEAKFAEMREERQALKDQDLTREERRAEREAHREELQAWANDNGIDLEAIRPEKGEGMGRPMRHGQDEVNQEVGVSEEG